MRNVRKHLKRLIAVFAIAGMVALTPAPASAWSQSWTRWHCQQWFNLRTNPGTVQPQAATHQVMLLATNMQQSKPAVQVKANAFYTTSLPVSSPGYAWRYNNLDLACYYSGGVGQSP